MKQMLKKVIKFYCVLLIKVFYPKCLWIIDWSPESIRGFVFFQRILNINNARKIPWPVHFTSKVFGDIRAGEMTSPGYAPGCYINAINGVDLGDNVWIGPSVKIISANHDIYDYSKHVKSARIKIGNNVWLGANAIILPDVTIGDNTIIGAGSVVTKSMPDNVIVAGNPARIIKTK